jgi:hypothetical protein
MGVARRRWALVGWVGSMLWLAGPLCAAPDPATRPAAGLVAEFQIPRWEYPILVPVRFGGRQHLLIADTNSTVTFFDRSLRGLLGEVKVTRRVLTAGGPVRCEFFYAPKAFVGRASLQTGGPVGCLDLAMPRRVVGRDVRGILGMALLRKYVLQIDHDGGRLRLLQPDAKPHPEWGTAVPMKAMRQLTPVVTVLLAGVGEVPFAIDTGDNSTLKLERKLFERLVRERKLKTATALYETAVGTLRQRAARVGDLALGGLKYRGLIASEGSGALPICWLGGKFLARHLVTFDFRNSRLYLKPGRRFAEADEGDMSGLHLLRSDGRTVVHSVDKDSPAAAAGVRAKDAILRVAGKAAGAYSMWQLRELLSTGHGRRLPVVIRRGGKDLQLQLVLKRRI